MIQQPTEVLNRINTALASAGVTASLTNDILTFTSDSTGTGSTVEITAADANAIAGLGIAVGAGTAGTSTTSYTINGAAVDHIRRRHHWCGWHSR